MISLELAKKLKDAGLVWEPKEGDWCYRRYNEQWKPRLITDGIENRYTSDIFAPSLSQLLAEIKGRGWRWGAGKNDGPYLVAVSKNSPLREIPHMSKAKIEDAAAMALLWVLEREAVG